MKTTPAKPLTKPLLACLFGLMLTASSAQAMYWDANGPTDGAGGPTPTGTWGVDAYWSTSAVGTNATTALTPGTLVIFSAGTDATGAFTVNVSGTQSAPAITFEDGDVTLAGGTLDLTNAAITVNSASATINSVITSSTSKGLIKQGPGTLTLGGANNYLGLTLVTNGTLRLSSAGIIPDGSALNVVATTNNNGFGVGGTTTFDLNGFNETVGSLAGAVSPLCSAVVALGSGSLTAGGDNSSTTNAAVITGSGGLTKVGTGLMSLTGANSYSGQTLVNGGTLKLGASGVLSDSSEVIVNGGTLSLATFSETVANVTLTNGAITGTAGAGNGTFTCGTLDIFNGTMQPNRLNCGNINLNGGTLGLGTITLSGFGIVCSGALNINGGTATLPSGSTFANDVRLNSGTLIIGTTNVVGFGTLWLNGGTIRHTSATARTITNAVSIGGNVTFDVPSSLTFSGPVTLTGQRVLTINNTNSITGVLGEDAAGRGFTKMGPGNLILTNVNTYSGPTIVNEGAIQLNQTGTLGDGSGTVTFSGGNFFTSAGRPNNPIPNPIVLLSDVVFQGNTTGPGPGYRYCPFSGPITTTSGTLTVKNNGTTNGLWTPRFHGSFDFTQPIIMGVTGDTGLVQIASFNTTTAGDQTFSGLLSGYGSFDRSVVASEAGTGGRTILTAANTYTGGTTVSDGTLLVNNTTGSGTGTGPVIVSTNGVLSGTGTIAGAVTVNVGGTLSPGASIGVLTVNNDVTLSGNTLIEMNKTAGTYDRLLGVNTLTYGGSLTVTNASGLLVLGDSFPIFAAATHIGSFTNIAPAPGSGLAWAFTNGVLSVIQGTAEPATLQFSLSGSALTLSWTETGAILQQTTDLGTTPIIWQDVPGAAAPSYQVNTATGTRFYRLKQ